MKFLLIALLVVGLAYLIVGTSDNVDYIRKVAPQAIAERGWTILRYEGFQYGSAQHHGGKVWYHVCNTDNPAIQYRVYIYSWRGELQFCYGQPEMLSRFQVTVPGN